MERNINQLTKKQQQLAEDNINLAYKYANTFASSFNLRHEFDDITSICLLALCKAARTYIVADGAFSTYAYKAMKHDLYDEFSGADGFKEYTPIEFVKYETQNNDTNILLVSDIIQDAFDRGIIGEREAVMLSMRFDDNSTYREIADCYSMSASNANRIVKKSLIKMRSNDIFIQDIF